MSPLIALAIKEIPAVIALLKARYSRQHPDANVPTDEEVLDAYAKAFQSSLAKDDEWLAAHPVDDGVG